jgi:hypothetical protein
MKNNISQRFVIQRKNKQRLLNLFPFLTDSSGIYILTREENGFKYAYVGQAKHILTRLADHLVGYQHIDLSLKNHGFYSENNETGWNVWCKTFKQEELNDKEQFYIKYMADKGYQLRNKTTGSQGVGKADIAENITKGYQKGIHQGYTNARKFVSNLFDKNLKVEIQGNDGERKQRALEKFNDFINIDKKESE